ncbi:MAG: ROK family protein, partial [Rhodohalobacter sp.]
LVPNTELGHIQLNGMVAEDYAANSIRKKEGLSWETWGERVNKYLQLIETLLWPDLIIIGGGVSKKFNKFEAFINVESTVVPAENRNHAGIIGAALAVHSDQKDSFLS